MLRQLSRNQLAVGLGLLALLMVGTVSLFLEQWLVSGVAAFLVLLGLGAVSLAAYARISRMHRRTYAISQTLERVAREGACREVTDSNQAVREELHDVRAKLGELRRSAKQEDVRSRKTLNLLRSEFRSIDVNLTAFRSSLESSQGAISEVRRNASAPGALRDIDLRSRKLINLVRSELPETKEAVRKVERSVQALSEQSSVSDRRLMNRIRNDTAVDALRSRLEQVERRLLGTIEEERLAAADRWTELRGRLVEQGSAVSERAAVTEGRLLKLLNEHEQALKSAINDLGSSSSVERNPGAQNGPDGQKAILQALEDTSARLRQRILSHVTHTVREDTRQVEALLQLLPKMPAVPAQLPPTGGFAIDAQALLHLLEILGRERPKLILELGGGTSTIWMGHICREFGTRIVSIDHLSEYHSQTLENVERHGLSDVVECRLAPLEEVRVGEHQFSWYSSDVFFDLRDVDFLLIDGPPEAVGDRARFPALPLLESLMSSRATVVLDDTHREGEQAILNDWRTLFPDFGHVDSAVSRLGVLSRSASSDT